MKPISVSQYFNRHKKKVAADVLIVVLSIVLVYLLQCFIVSIAQSIYPIDSNRLKVSSFVIGTEKQPNPMKWTVDGYDSSHIDEIVPIVIQQITFSIPGSTTHTASIDVDETNAKRLFSKYDIQLVAGRMPIMNSKEIALDERVAKNNRVTIGDCIGKLHDGSQSLPDSYKIVGLLKSESYLSFTNHLYSKKDDLKLNQRAAIVFPKKGREKEAEKEVRRLNKLGYNTWTESMYQELYDKNQETFKVLDVVVVLAIFVTAICLSCIKYVQYFGRKKELGILLALGYSNNQIIQLMIKEVVTVNILGFILGTLLSIGSASLILPELFERVGGTSTIFYLKALGLSSLAPIIMSIVIIFPITSMLSKMDCISIITNPQL